MKKTVVLLLLVLSIFTLAGCQEEGEDVTDTVAPVISGTDDITLVLGDQEPNWLDGITAIDDIDGTVSVSIDDSNVDLLTPGIYDLTYTAVDDAGNQSIIIVNVIVEDPELDSFYVELVNLNGDIILYEPIPYNFEDLSSIVELIDAVVDLDYTVYDFGTMINGIGGNYPKEYGVTYNYYYELQVDGQSSLTGIDDVQYSDGTIISFVETTFMSELDKKVDDLIYTFIDTKISNYISDDYMDYSVLAAVHQMIEKGYIDLSLNDFYTYSNLELTQLPITELSISELFRLGIYQSVNGMDLTSFKNQLLTLNASNQYELTTYLQAYHLFGGVESNLATILMDDPIGDPDFAGMALLALDRYSHLEGIDTYITSVTDYIKGSLSSTGITSWGNSNSASTATVIFGLVAQGINPQAEDYQVDGKGLIDMLMAYEVDYNFKWLLGDANADLMFSTPQAFAALVAYKLSRDVYGFTPTNLYSFVIPE